MLSSFTGQYLNTGSRPSPQKLKKSNPQTVSKFIGKADTDTSKLLRRAQALGKLDALVQSALPHNLQYRCRIANIRNKQLIILAESAAWATLLRYEQANILSHLQSHADYAFVQSVVVKVAPQEQQQHQEVRTAKTPGFHAQASIRALANLFEGDPLGDSVRRLAKTLDDENE